MGFGFTVLYTSYTQLLEVKTIYFAAFTANSCSLCFDLLKAEDKKKLSLKQKSTPNKSKY